MSRRSSKNSNRPIKSIELAKVKEMSMNWGLSAGLRRYPKILKYFQKEIFKKTMVDLDDEFLLFSSNRIVSVSFVRDCCLDHFGVDIESVVQKPLFEVFDYIDKNTIV